VSFFSRVYWEPFFPVPKAVRTQERFRHDFSDLPKPLNHDTAHDVNVVVGSNSRSAIDHARKVVFSGMRFMRNAKLGLFYYINF
jgi:hypothetical protein